MTTTTLTRSYWEADRSVPVLDVTMGQVLRDAAADSPDAVALVDGVAGERRRWTYRELLASAEGVAQVLHGRYAPGDRLAIWAPNMPEWEMLQFGAALAGLVIVAVNPAYTASELRYVLEHSGARAIVVADSYRDTDMPAVAHALREELPALEDVLRIAPDSELWTTGDTGRPLPRVSAGDPAIMQYTSGTTGSPKGAVLTHRALCNNSRLFGRRMALPDHSVWLNCMPMFHIGGSSFGAIGSMWTRSAHVVTSFDPGLMLDLLEQERPSFLPSVPTMILALREHESFARRDLGALQVIMAGSTTISPEIVRVVEEDFGCSFISCFGQTEASGVIALGHPDDALADKSGRVGQPLEQVDVQVVDPVSGETVPVGEVGEFCLRGYTTMREYFGMPDATAATLDADGWLHTGDLGMMDARGYLQVSGRLKEMIIRGGENIYPREIEDLLAAHPGISEVAVVGVPDDYWGEQVAAVVRPTPEQPADVAAWQAYARSRLASAKVPRRWFVVGAMPTNPSGKIQKFRLRGIIADGDAHEVTPARD